MLTKFLLTRVSHSSCIFASTSSSSLHLPSSSSSSSSSFQLIGPTTICGCRHYFGTTKTTTEFGKCEKRNNTIQCNNSSRSSKELREAFLAFFASHGHKRVASAPVLTKHSPYNQSDFICAGVQQFVPVLIGQCPPPASRVVNSQKCVRLVDKDLVGQDNQHHTFFEMLGNWSFGDYHKEEACKLAWHFLTQVLGIEPRRLYITYFDGNGVDGEGDGDTNNGNNNKVFEPDLETRDIWRRIGVPDSHLLPFDAASNFWRLGPIGPCGPCTEIHVDMNDAKELPSTDEGKEIARRLLVNTDDPSMVELWNLVFMQYNRQPDGSLVPLPIGNVVDTGLGLERLCALMQGCQSAYDTDLFRPLIGRISELSPTKPVYRGRLDPHDIDGVDTAFRIVADHIRTLVITLAEGVRITNSKKYARKLKAMFKRTALMAHEKLGVRRGALADLVPLVVEQLGDAHPNLRRNQQQVMDKVRAEEARMWVQRDAGRARLADIIEGLPADAISFSGKHAFELAKVYRLELDLIGEAAAQRGLEVNEKEFRELTEKWRRNTHTTAATAAE